MVLMGALFILGHFFGDVMHLIELLANEFIIRVVLIVEKPIHCMVLGCVWNGPDLNLQGSYLCGVCNSLHIKQWLHAATPSRSASSICSDYIWYILINHKIMAYDIYFGSRVYLMGCIVIALLVRPLVCWSVGPSVFKYIGNCSLEFSETLHQVVGQ